jgi:hypothetical protein
VDPQARGEVLGIADFARIAEQHRPADTGAASADAVR